MDARQEVGGTTMETHHEHHSHDHDHGGLFHTHAPAHQMKKALFLTIAILVVEFAGGLLSHSLALLSDAGHVLTDIAAIGLTLYALQQAKRPADDRMTFGYHRSGILAALVNGVTLIVVTLVIVWEAIARLRHPEVVSGAFVFISPAIGLIVNLYLGLGLRHEDNINVKSAMLHILGDAAASAGVIIGGVIMYFTGWYVVDPILSLVIAVMIAFGAWRIVRQTVSILMEGIPSGLDFDRVVDEIRAVTGVLDVHDVHVWSIGSGRNALSCHVVLDGRVTVHDSQQVLRETEHRLVHLGIGHVTIQTEDGDHPHEASVLCCEGETRHVHV